MSTSILLPDDLHADLKALAEQEQRSLHRQIIWILQRYRDEQRARREQLATTGHPKLDASE